MTLNDYITHLEPQVDSALVYEIREWSNDNKLYMYLHNIQLAHMAEFKKMLLEMKDARGI